MCRSSSTTHGSIRECGTAGEDILRQKRTPALCCGTRSHSRPSFPARCRVVATPSSVDCVTNIAGSQRLRDDRLKFCGGQPIEKSNRKSITRFVFLTDRQRPILSRTFEVKARGE